MKRLCLICARGGSEGVKNKNIRILKGTPLIAHSIIQAQKSKLFDFISVSSDSDPILSVARDYGVDFLIKRSAEMATSRAAKLPVIQHAVLETEKKIGYTFDTVVDLDATSPLRYVSDIISAVRLLEDAQCDNVITGAVSRRSPYFNMVELNDDGVVCLAKKPMDYVCRRQDAPKCYDMNASIYAWKRNILLQSQQIFLENTRLYVMPEERSIDIDSELDYEFVKFIANGRGDLC
jgi:CMP-N,N'-diacetyllegionaminic acid synthase